MSVVPLADRLRQRIRDEGPLLVSDWVDAALYDPDAGFYMTGGRAGRRGDFLTAPEVGPLFGAVLGRAVDLWWREAGRPDVFPVFDVGAGPGTLARTILRSECEAVRSGALRWWAVDISPAQRGRHPEHELVGSTATLAEAVSGASRGGDAVPGGVVLANELLDNLAFDVVERTESGWTMVMVTVEPGGDGFATTTGPLDSSSADVLARLAPNSAPGQRLPWQTRARGWLATALAAVPNGRVVVFDYAASTQELLAREGGWLRTHAGHTGDHDWLDRPGDVDITVDVDLDQLQFDYRAHSIQSQADFLRTHGIDQLVDEGRQVWSERAHIGDLVALTARSRVAEQEALCDPAGMGSFVTAQWFS